MRSLCMIVATFALVACGGNPPAAQPRTVAPPPASAASASPCPPTGWVESEMVASDLPGAKAPAGMKLSANVLAWRVKEDERPLRVEAAIVRVRVTEPSGTLRWLLLHVFRHPEEKDGYANVWRLAQVADTPITGVERYDAEPRLDQIETFMRETGWDDGLAGFRELGGGTCRVKWPR